MPHRQNDNEPVGAIPRAADGPPAIMMTTVKHLALLRQALQRKWDEGKIERKIIRQGKWFEPLHGDPVLQGLVDEIISDCEISVFVETGTFVGDTARFVAKRHPNVEVLTCEVNPRWLKLAKRLCQGIENIQFFLGQSPQFLERSYDMLKSSNVLFWLDAHWGAYWPLMDETKIISSLPRFAAIVDDFEVPGRPIFQYDAYGGIKNDLALNAASLGRECLVPNYVPDSHCKNPAGYGLFFRGMNCSGSTIRESLRRLSI